MTVFLFPPFINVLFFSLEVNYPDEYSTFKPGIIAMEKG